jgi:hypothetical protein
MFPESSPQSAFFLGINPGQQLLYEVVAHASVLKQRQKNSVQTWAPAGGM